LVDDVDLAIILYFFCALLKQTQGVVVF